MKYSDAVILFGAPDAAHDLGQKILRELEEEADARIHAEEHLSHVSPGGNRGNGRQRPSDPHY